MWPCYVVRDFINAVSQTCLEHLNAMDDLLVAFVIMVILYKKFKTLGHCNFAFMRTI